MHTGGGSLRPVTMAVVGAGDRGSTYAKYALLHPDRAKVVAVAEPNPHRREKMVREHGIPEHAAFDDWQALAERERLADAVIISTQDAMHTGPAVALAERGYHILLEKPMAPTEEECKRIVRAALSNHIIFAVCHVLRYTTYTRVLKSIVDSGMIGEVVSLQRLEPVGYWHQAHSFVRGNWRREDQSSFMLLAKSCHDIDWMRYIVGKRCAAVSSFGGRSHFRPEKKPPEASDRCLDCDYESKCPYSAKKIYMVFLRGGTHGWPLSVITDEVSEESVAKALREGPYGRCVYGCDNDVVDHQVVNMEFEGGQTASFTMTAFTRARAREDRVFGTRGEIQGDGSEVRVHDFLTDTTVVFRTDDTDSPPLGGHGGGDYHLIDTFVRAVALNDSALILSGPLETLETHLVTFAAERSRRERCVVEIDISHE
ncbi:MAG: Gfo/Idh/MocA family oxidoreductase [Candidatus Thorarchaeota archaeon]|nr:Gfo/Idh/MocA family oxidoreductase [Candidatus Thorarchaeota archaeon]